MVKGQILTRGVLAVRAVQPGVAGAHSSSSASCAELSPSILGWGSNRCTKICDELVHAQPLLNNHFSWE